MRQSRTAWVLGVSLWLTAGLAQNAASARADPLTVELGKHQFAIPRGQFLPRFHEGFSKRRKISRRSIYLGFLFPSLEGLATYDDGLEATSPERLQKLRWTGQFVVEVTLTSPARDNRSPRAQHFLLKAATTQPQTLPDGTTFVGLDSMRSQGLAGVSISSEAGAADGGALNVNFYRSMESPELEFNCTDSLRLADKRCVSTIFDDDLRMEVVFLEENIRQWRDIVLSARKLVDAWRQ